MGNGPGFSMWNTKALALACPPWWVGHTREECRPLSAAWRLLRLMYSNPEPAHHPYATQRVTGPSPEIQNKSNCYVKQLKILLSQLEKLTVLTFVNWIPKTQPARYSIFAGYSPQFSIEYPISSRLDVGFWLVIHHYIFWMPNTL